MNQACNDIGERKLSVGEIFRYTNRIVAKRLGFYAAVILVYLGFAFGIGYYCIDRLLGVETFHKLLSLDIFNLNTLQSEFVAIFKNHPAATDPVFYLSQAAMALLLVSLLAFLFVFVSVYLSSALITVSSDLAVSGEATLSGSLKKAFKRYGKMIVAVLFAGLISGLVSSAASAVITPLSILGSAGFSFHFDYESVLTPTALAALINSSVLFLSITMVIEFIFAAIAQLLTLYLPFASVIKNTWAIKGFSRGFDCMKRNIGATCVYLLVTLLPPLLLGTLGLWLFIRFLSPEAFYILLGASAVVSVLQYYMTAYLSVVFINDDKLEWKKYSTQGSLVGSFMPNDRF